MEPLEPRRLLTAAAEVAKLVASDAYSSRFFGSSVSISDGTALIGAVGQGAYVFVLNDGAWTQEAELIASDAEALDSYGVAVAISGDTAVIGSYRDDDAGSES